MRVLVAFNAFKEALTARQACEAAARAIQRAWPEVRVLQVPIGDGGDGTLEALAQALGSKARFHKATVTGPVFTPVTARWLELPGGEAYLEMAQASGLALVPPHQRDPYRTTSLGTGELIRAALEHGARRIFLGVGGSATVDGGLGALTALGFRFLDSQGRPVPPTGEGLVRLHRILPPDQGLPDLDLTVLVDVKNPLLGPEGAARVYGPQKGATPEQVKALEQGLRKLRDLVKALTGRDIQVPGGGAAGGIAASLYGLLGAKLEPGSEVFLRLVDFDRRLQEADLVLTGEGKFDEQSRYGKGPWAVLQHAARYGKPVWVLAGAVGTPLPVLPDGVGVLGIQRAVYPLPEALARTSRNLADTVEHLFRVLRPLWTAKAPARKPHENGGSG